MQSITTQVALKLIPVVNQSLKGFNNFLKANKALVVEGLTNVFKWVLKLGQVFTNTFRFLNKVISSTIGWKAALLILVGVLAVVKRAMLAAFLTNPIGWVIMLIGALMLVIDDLMTYLDGGESLFGDYWKPCIEWGKKAIALYKEIEPTIKEVWDFVVNYITQCVNAIIGVFKILYGVFTGDWELIKQGFKDVGDAILKAFEVPFKWIKKQYDEYIAPIINAVKNFDIGQTASDMWEGAKSFLGFGNDTPKAALATQYADNNRSVQYNGGTATTTINVNTNNPQMANQIINNRQKNDLAFTQANLRGGY